MTGLTDFLRGSWVLTLLTVQLGYRTLMVVIWMQSKLQQLHCIWRQAARLLGGVLPSWWCHQCCRNPTSLCTLPRITKSPLVHCVSSSAARSTCANQRDGACLSGLIYTPWSDHMLWTPVLALLTCTVSSRSSSSVWSIVGWPAMWKKKLVQGCLDSQQMLFTKAIGF